MSLKQRVLPPQAFDAGLTLAISLLLMTKLSSKPQAHMQCAKEGLAHGWLYLWGLLATGRLASAVSPALFHLSPGRAGWSSCLHLRETGWHLLGEFGEG